MVNEGSFLSRLFGGGDMINVISEKGTWYCDCCGKVGKMHSICCKCEEELCKECSKKCKRCGKHFCPKHIDKHKSILSQSC